MAADTFPPDVNGAAKFTVNLAAGMAARGHEVHVAVPSASRRHGTWAETYDDETITVHRLPSDRYWPHDWLRYVKPWMARRHMRRVLDEVKPDVVHYQSAVVLGRAVVREGAGRGIRIIGTNHLMLENMLEHTLLPKPLQEIASRIWWRDAHKTFAATAALTTPTRRAADFLERNGGLERVLAISCGLRKSDYAPDFSEKRPRRVLFVGRVTGEKQIDVLIRAFATLGDLDDAHLDIVGGGDQRTALERLARELGLDERVTFHGYASDEELKTLYTGATVFAIASIAELQSIATMEAMASGLPVVAANAMALPHLVHEGVNGHLFAPGDVDDCAAKLRRVLEAPQAERERLGREGLRLVDSHDIDSTMTLFERLYYGESVDDVAKDSANEQDHSLDFVVEPVTGSIPTVRREPEA
ncbi:MAG: glycosyltransferase family 4 protein [Microbacteriaceae bacterium]|nr:glycosyltransferase family 4 protein [Microbacteriaceae bacterium]